jgi:glycosyl transferase family 87
MKSTHVLAWVCACLMFAIFLYRTAIPATQQSTPAFSVYYTSAYLTLQGEAGGQFCGPWFFDQQRRLGLKVDFFCPSPPTMALIMLPIAWLSPGPARFLWITLDLCTIAIICAIAWRLKGGTLSYQLYIPFALIVISIYKPLHVDLWEGQVYTIIALFYAIWLYGWTSGRDWICGAAMAALALAKLSGWPLWLFMIAYRRWQALLWAIGLALAGVLVTLPLLSIDFWRLYIFDQLVTIAPEPSNAATAYQTLTSLLRQYFVYNERWSPTPLLDAPWLATSLWWLLTIVLLGITLRHGAADRTLLTPMALFCLIIPLQPAGEQHHYTLLLVVLLSLIGLYSPALRPSTFDLICVSIVIILFALPSYFLWTQRLGGWPLAILAYPRMWGALLLWGILILLRKRWIVSQRSLVV